MTDFPMPGTKWRDATVIASGDINDDFWGVLLLGPEPPFYWLAEIRVTDGETTIVATHFNIVPAAEDFDETFGFWGGS